MKKIETRQLTIAKAFKEHFYIVPDYQREYVWEEKQVSQLLEDIHEQMDSSPSEYFIGTVLVSPVKDKRGVDEVIDVIDGQQRLTTAFLILCALRAFFKDKGMEQSGFIGNLISTEDATPQGAIKTDIRLKPQYEDSGRVIKEIVQANGDPKSVRASIQRAHILINGPVKNILDAYNIIYRFLTDNYDANDKLEEYLGHLANNITFIQISTDVSHALKIFETINERGVGLNPMDLLKNLLFTQVPPEQFDRLKEKWKTITSLLEKHKKKPLRFLRYFIMANYEIKNDVIREDEIYDWFSDNAELAGYQKDPFEFVRQINQNVKRYIDLGKGHGKDGGPNLAMDSLKNLTREGFSLHYILLLAAANLPESLFDHFVAQLESFLFYYIFTKSPTKELENNFSSWADEVRRITLIEDPEKQKDEFNTFIAERFAKNIDKKTPELQDALKRLTLDSMQQYRIKYFLARLAQHVDMAYRGQRGRRSLEDYLELDIEHILPNNPEADLRKKWQEQHPEPPYDDAKNRIGNLTLLEKPINIVAGNSSFENKKGEYAKSSTYFTKSIVCLEKVGKDTSVSRINEKLHSFDEWNAETIEERQSMLIKLAEDVWKTDNI